MRLASADSNESVCAGTMIFNIPGNSKATRKSNDLMQKYGFGHWQLMPTMSYLRSLYTRGLVGKGKQIECDLPLDQFNSPGFPDLLMSHMAERKGHRQ